MYVLLNIVLMTSSSSIELSPVAPIVIVTFITVIQIIFVALYAWMIIWMRNLSAKGCKCAVTWKKTFIEILFGISLVMFFASFFFNIPMHLTTLLFVFFIIGVSITRMFITEIRRDECACADTLSLKVLDVINYLQITILIICAILVLKYLLLYY